MSGFILNHFATTKQQARLALDEADRQPSTEIVESAKERGKNSVLEDILNRHVAAESGI